MNTLPFETKRPVFSVAIATFFFAFVYTTDAFVPQNRVACLPAAAAAAAETRTFTTTTSLFVASEEVSAREALERTKQRLEELQRQQRQQTNNIKLGSSLDPRIEQQTKEYLSFPAHALKQELKSHGLPTKGRKPDLAKRLAEFEYLREHPDEVLEDSNNNNDGMVDTSQRPTNYLDPTKKSKGLSEGNPFLDSFCGISLSNSAAKALGKARFHTPTPIQRNSLPLLDRGHSAVLHAETGSGKTLAYLLPITEALWREELGEAESSLDDDDLRYGMILTPTRELAAQVAGVASVLAPPGSVRLVSRPTNLMSESRYWKERRGDRIDDVNMMSEETQAKGRGSPPRLFIGSAKAIMASLYGDGKMPASPTRKPAAKELLSHTRWIVLDEVDRLLNLQHKKGLSTAQRNQMARKDQKRNGSFQYGESSLSSSQKNTGPLHEKPAAILTSAVARRTLGRAQVIAASATVGRSLKRELSRVLGLPPKEYPRVIQGDTPAIDDYDTNVDRPKGQHVDRAITIPNTVSNFVLPVDASSTGKLLTSAYFAIKNLNDARPQKILMVLTNDCGITTTNAIGALKHFKCDPRPQSLLDVLQDANGNDQLMEVHRRVTQSDGIGEESSSNDNYFGDGETNNPIDDSSSSHHESYLFVTGEDTVRGMHLAGLDTVVVVGRAKGPDEYIHIAGRTGRAGKSGKVLNVLSEAHAKAMMGWEKMLNVHFERLGMDDLEGLE